MNVLNFGKILLGMGVLSVALTSCNMEDHKKEERKVEKQTEVKKVDKNGAEGVIREDRTHTETTHRPAE